jgi:hypothetical protein
MDGGGSRRIVHATDPKEAVEAIRGTGRRIVTFVGFSGNGYEEPMRISNLLADLLNELNRDSVIVCSGATEDGIGAVYPIAKQRRFSTIGIVSAVAETEKARFSDAVDTIYIISDKEWGGRRSDGTLSPTSTAMVNAADEIIAIGGGKIARDEIEAAKAAGKPVRYEPADMNHAAALETARRKGEVAPQDFKGPVHSIFDC